MSKSNTQHESNVIFLADCKRREDQNPDGSTDSAIFCELPHGTPKEMWKMVENAENGGEYVRKARVVEDVANCSRTELRLLYPGAYSSWKNAKQRCKEGNGVLHPDFGKFPDFLLAMGPRPAKGYTVDRIDHTNPEYAPGLVRWASKALQTANRRNTRMLTDSNGITDSVAEWSRRFRVPVKTIHERMRREWSVDDAVRILVGGRRSSQGPRKSHDSANTKQFVEIWKRIHKDTHEQGFFSPTGKDLGQIAHIIKTFADGGTAPARVIEHVLTNWRDFISYAETEYGAWQEAPNVPTIAYLASNIQAAGNYYLDSRKTKQEPQEPKGMWEEVKGRWG